MAEGQSNEALGHAERAEEAYRRGVELRKSDPAPKVSALEVEAAYGLFVYRQGRMEEAEAILANAGPGGAFTRARALFQLGRLDESLKLLEPLYAMLREAHELASRIYYRKGDTAQGDKHAAQGSIRK